MKNLAALIFTLALLNLAQVYARGGSADYSKLAKTQCPNLTRDYATDTIQYTIFNQYQRGACLGPAYDLMEQAFSKDAYIHIYWERNVNNPFFGPIGILSQDLMDGGKSPNLKGAISDSDRIGNGIAWVRLEETDWSIEGSGPRDFTDLFLLVKNNNHWEIVTKLSHVYPQGTKPTVENDNAQMADLHKAIQEHLDAKKTWNTKAITAAYARDAFIHGTYGDQKLDGPFYQFINYVWKTRKSPPQSTYKIKTRIVNDVQKEEISIVDTIAIVAIEEMRNNTPKFTHFLALIRKPGTTTWDVVSEVLN